MLRLFSWISTKSLMEWINMIFSGMSIHLCSYMMPGGRSINIALKQNWKLTASSLPRDCKLFLVFFFQIGIEKTIFAKPMATVLPYIWGHAHLLEQRHLRRCNYLTYHLAAFAVDYYYLLGTIWLLQGSDWVTTCRCYTANHPLRGAPVFGNPRQL